MMQLPFANEELRRDLGQLTQILKGVDEGADFDVDVVGPVVERFQEKFYGAFEQELEIGMKVLEGFKNSVIIPTLGAVSKETQISRKSRFSLEEKMILSMLKGDIIFDLYRGRSVIESPGIDPAKYKGLERILDGHPNLIEKLPEIDFVEVKEALGQRRFGDFLEEYERMIEPFNIRMIYGLLPGFERAVERYGGKISNISPTPFKYGRYSLTSMIQRFSRFMDPSRSLTATVSKFKDYRAIEEVISALRNEAVLLETEHIKDSDESLFFADKTQYLWSVVQKGDLLITIRSNSENESILRFIEDSRELAEAYVKRNKDLEISPDDEMKEVLNHSLTMEHLPPNWFMERSLDREGDIDYITTNFVTLGENGTKKPIFFCDGSRERERYEDRIAVPKKNGYQTIKYRIYILSSPEAAGFPIEWQLRTNLMHYHADFGKAKHLDFKDRRYEEIRRVNGERKSEKAQEGGTISLRGIFSEGDERTAFLNTLQEILDEYTERKVTERIINKAEELKEVDVSLISSASIKDAESEIGYLVDRYIEDLRNEPGDWTPVREVIESLPLSYYANSGFNILRRYEEAEDSLYPILTKANEVLGEEDGFNVSVETPQQVQLRHYEALVNFIVEPKNKKQALLCYGFLKLAEEYEEMIAELEKNEKFEGISQRLETAKKKNFVKSGEFYYPKSIDTKYIRKHKHHVTEIFQPMEEGVLERELSTYLGSPDIALLGYDNLKFVVDNACEMMVALTRKDK